MMDRLLNFLSNHPVNGMVAIRPIGKANSTAPNWASFKCNCCLIDGILDAHEEYPKPEIKKKKAHAMRYERGVRTAASFTAQR